MTKLNETMLNSMFQKIGLFVLMLLMVMSYEKKKQIVQT